MSRTIDPKAIAIALGILQSLTSVVLILIPVACVYLSLAAAEAPREYWWTYWTIYAFIGLSCLLGAGLLLRKSFTAIVLTLIAAACIFPSIAVIDFHCNEWWTNWTVCALVWTTCAVVGLSCSLRAGWLLGMSRGTS